MPRYIDAELALELHNGELWAWDVPDLKEFLAEVPTADVVPKSEYDRLEKLYNDMTQEAKGYLNRLYGIRADVAREIFEEIDVLVDDWKHCYIQSIQFIAELAELKKKYMEAKE